MKLVHSAIEVSETEQGGYYSLGKAGIRLEILVKEGRLSESTVGARWTIDGWKTWQDTSAFYKGPTSEGEMWQLEIRDLAVIGWRNGSIGGPNGEQPSGNVWTLFGASRTTVRCLSLGSPIPVFEFALFVKRGNTTSWNNNKGRNFRLDLSAFGRKPARQE